MPIPSAIQSFIDHQADAATTTYDDLRAVVFNGTLKRSPEPSQTDGLLAIARGVLERVGVRVDVVRTVDHVIPPGVWPDMTTQGYERDDFPRIYRELVEPADIIMIAGPIWLGDQSSQTRTIIERLYAYSGEVNAAGQWSYYGKVGGAVTTGNEDGGKHVSAQVLYALQHIGLTIPPQSDAYWNGEAGPGDSYSDPGSGGPRERLDDPQHRLHDLEPPALRAHAQGRRRHPRLRQLHPRLGPRPPRPPQPGVPLKRPFPEPGSERRHADPASWRRAFDRIHPRSTTASPWPTSEPSWRGFAPLSRCSPEASPRRRRSSSTTSSHAGWWRARRWSRERFSALTRFAAGARTRTRCEPGPSSPPDAA